MSSLLTVLYPLFFDLEQASVHVLAHMAMADSVIRETATQEQLMRFRTVSRASSPQGSPSQSPTPSQVTQTSEAPFTLDGFQAWKAYPDALVTEFEIDNGSTTQSFKILVGSINPGYNRRVNSDQALNHWLMETRLTTSTRTHQVDHLPVYPVHPSTVLLSQLKYVVALDENDSTAEVKETSLTNLASGAGVRALQLDSAMMLQTLPHFIEKWKVLQVRIRADSSNARHTRHPEWNPIYVPISESTKLTIFTLKHKILHALYEDYRTHKLCTVLQRAATLSEYERSRAISTVFAATDALRLADLPEMNLPHTLSHGLSLICEELVQVTRRFLETLPSIVPPAELEREKRAILTSLSTTRMALRSAPHFKPTPRSEPDTTLPLSTVSFALRTLLTTLLRCVDATEVHSGRGAKAEFETLYNNIMSGMMLLDLRGRNVSAVTNTEASYVSLCQPGTPVPKDNLVLCDLHDANSSFTPIVATIPSSLYSTIVTVLPH